MFLSDMVLNERIKNILVSAAEMHLIDRCQILDLVFHLGIFFNILNYKSLEW